MCTTISSCSYCSSFIKYFHNSAFFLNTKIPRPGSALLDYVHKQILKHLFKPQVELASTFRNQNTVSGTHMKKSRLLSPFLQLTYSYFQRYTKAYGLTQKQLSREGYNVCSRTPLAMLKLKTFKDIAIKRDKLCHG